MNPRYTFLLDQYQKLDTVYGGIILIAAYFPLMGHLLDRLITARFRRWMDAVLVTSLLAYLAFMFYCGWINRSGG